MNDVVSTLKIDALFDHAVTLTHIFGILNVTGLYQLNSINLIQTKKGRSVTYYEISKC